MLLDAPVEVRRGLETTVVSPSAGTRTVPLGQSERVEIRLPAIDGATYTGYQVVNGERRALPLTRNCPSSSGSM